jgi:adenosylhomocysteinase
VGVRLGIEWVIESCRLLAAIGDEFDRTLPFDGLRIGTGIHLEPKTVALLLTLARGGAEVISTGNLNTTQQEALDYLGAHGVRPVGAPTSDPAEHDAHLREVLAAEPQLLLDNGGDLFTRWLESPYDGLVGGTEETTSGRMRLGPLRDRLRLPILVINDSPIKQFAENRHAVGQSTVESYLRITNRSTNGKRVTVFGYGACGRGVAAHFRNAFAEVSVVEVDPVTRLEALLDGFAVPDKPDALSRADVVVTATGARDVVTAADLPMLADDTVLMNVGHFPVEIDVPAIRAAAEEAIDAADGIETLRLPDGRRLHLLTGGHMVNLAGPRPLGNSIESMDLGFALQARCLEAVAAGKATVADCVVPVPASIDAAVASAYVTLQSS